jgi:NAD(P)-dependent dehydrogenase (short-subunit alcohol dehydrogenase family)
MRPLKAQLPASLKRWQKKPCKAASACLKRPAQPAEIAPLYAFLASQEASYITDMIYGITGGDPIA